MFATITCSTIRFYQHFFLHLICGLLSVSALGFSGRSLADTYVVQANESADFPYANWETAASNIQDAVNAAAEGATVWIRPGTYTLPPNPTNFFGLNVVYINKPLTLQGVGDTPEAVVIDGEDQYRGIAIEAPGSTAIPYVFRNVTVANGYTADNGGGILFGGTTGTWPGIVDHCIIRDNEAVGSGSYPGGGGLYAAWPTGYFSLTVSNSVLRGNMTAEYGGGLNIRVAYKPVDFVNCLIEDNRARSGGGLYWRSHAQVTLEACTIRNNQTTSSGGGLTQSASAAPFRMRNCLLHGNVSSSNGGALYALNAGAPLHIESCTITSNRNATSGNTGSGIHVRGSTLSITNSIVQRNASEQNLSFHLNTDRDGSYFFHACLSPTNNLSGTALINADPSFINFDGGNYQLKSTSPCVNAGQTLPWMTGALDLADRRRVDAASGIVDLGCFEHHELGTVICIQ